MVDLIEPNERYDAMEYARHARVILAAIAARDVQPLVVGGTGFYLEALMGNISENLPRGSAEIRLALQAELREKGPLEMWQRLKDLDEQTAQRLHPKDRSRIVRALEIIQTTGVPLSTLTAGSPPRPWGTWHVVVLTMDREALKARIHERTEQMMRSGWGEEVERLLAAGYDEDSPGMSGLGYAEMVEVVRGELTIEEAKQRISLRTWRYARRQLTWFSRFPKDRWITTQDDPAATATRVLELLAGPKEPAGR
jgi:tRNA dimethylallyltransferase